MSFAFRPAVRENVGLLIGLPGPSGSGKTFTALRLATGLAGGKKFCVIDTESGRARHYADLFQFDHGLLEAPFRPERYLAAIEAAITAGYPVIVVDSASHEHAGEGGLLDWHEEELTRMAGDNYQRREACKMTAWVKPKMAHKKFMQRLINLPPSVHLLLCFRAEAKIEMVRGKDGGWEVGPKRSLTGLDGWIPICEKTMPYELTMSFLLTPDAPGVPKPIKLQEQHRPFFPLDQVITEQCGEQLAAWARGGKMTPVAKPSPPPSEPLPFIDPGRPAKGAPDPQLADLRQGTIAAIAQARRSFKKPVPDSIWHKLCEAKLLGLGADELAQAEPALLEDFLKFVQAIAAGDATAIKEANAIVVGSK